MANHVQLFFDFIKRSPSAFHAAKTVASLLDASGYTKLSENQPWTIVPGGKYYVTRNNSSVIAFAIPETGFAHFQIVSSHSDSPCFKLKNTCEDEAAGYLLLNVERYGGMIMSSWFDRPLSIAGRVLVKEGSSLTTRLVDLDRDALIIPNMPIHFNREVNDGYKYNAQVDLLPLFGGKACRGKLKAEIAKGTFREDLYHRLSVIVINVPSLDERKSDIPLLVDFFIDQICSETGMQPRQIDDDAMQMLVEKSWTGNIRELRNVVERLLILSGDRITVSDIKSYVL